MNTLAQNQIDFFHDQGYLIVENVLDTETLAAVRGEYEALLDRLAHDYHAADRLSSTFTELDFDTRYTHILRECPEIYEHLDITLPVANELRPDAGFHAGPAVFRVMTHAPLLDMVESLLGPEIYSNPVQHVRIKPPVTWLSGAAKDDSNTARTRWHQDAAVVLEEARDTEMLTVWVAISDATRANGCMWAAAGSHRDENLLVHCPGKRMVSEIYIPDALIDPASRVPLEVGAGGVVLLHRRTAHSATDNRTERLRWSFDLRYQPPGQPTGRDCFPGFLARSRQHPEQVLDNPEGYRQNWLTARQRIACGEVTARFNTRWNAYAGVKLCA